MQIKVLAGSALAAGLLGFGILVGGVAGPNGALAQTAGGTVAALVQVANTPIPSAPAAPAAANSDGSAITAKITQKQAEAAALAANPGSTVDHTTLQNQNGSPVYDVDFTNGGGALVNGDTGAVITNEAAGLDTGGRGGHGGRGGADQAALAAKATVTQQQAEQTALSSSAGSTVDHSNLAGDPNGVVFWDVDFANGGGVQVNAQTGVVITVEAAGTDQGGKHGGRGHHDDAPSTGAATPVPTP